MLKKVFPLGPVSTNCILLASENERSAVCIDAPQGSCSTLWDFLQEQEFSLQALWLTHSHWDHIVDAEAIRQEFDVPVFVHTLDKDNTLAPGVDGLSPPLMVPPVKQVQEFHEGSLLYVGSSTFIVLHTPGHTPGGSCFYNEKEHLLISGDTLFKGAYGRLDLSTANEKNMKESLKRLASLPPDTQVLAGHGPMTTIGTELSWLLQF